MCEEMFEEIGCEEVDWNELSLAHEANAFHVEIDRDDSIIEDFENLVDMS
jgi:hypothetical protein